MPAMPRESARYGPPATRLTRPRPPPKPYAGKTKQVNSEPLNVCRSPHYSRTSYAPEVFPPKASVRSMSHRRIAFLGLDWFSVLPTQIVFS